jgi:Flp pilus assembly protein TadB
MLKQFVDECVDLVKSGDPMNDAMRSIGSNIENLAVIRVAIRRTGKMKLSTALAPTPRTSP